MSDAQAGLHVCECAMRSCHARGPCGSPVHAVIFFKDQLFDALTYIRVVLFNVGRPSRLRKTVFPFILIQSRF